MKEKKIVMILCTCCIVMCIILIGLSRNGDDKTLEFDPPPFDNHAVKGKPQVPDDYNWSELMNENIEFSIGLSGRLVIDDDNNIAIYFYNGEDNQVWLKLRVYDFNKNIIAETGLIKPGEYIKEIELQNKIRVGEHIKVKVMSYQPETYYSEGAFILDMKMTDKE